MKRCKGPEYKIGIKDPYTRQQLCLKIERTSEGIDWMTFGLEFVKGATTMFNGLWKARDWTVWWGQRPPEQENKEQTWRDGPL
jgi:hypothetical protein